jgi:hypothetical protein
MAYNELMLEAIADLDTQELPNVVDTARRYKVVKGH